MGSIQQAGVLLLPLTCLLAAVSSARSSGIPGGSRPAAAAAITVATPISSPLLRVAEVRLQFHAPAANPWAITNCSAHVLGPAASRHAAMVLPLFYDGTAASNGGGADSSGSQTAALVFAFRFTPDVAGRWIWQLACAPLELVGGGLSSGSVEVSAAGSGSGRGGARASPRSPQQFEREDGGRWIPVGYEIDWLWALGLDDGDDADTDGGHGTVAAAPPSSSVAQVEAALDLLSSFGFNHLLVSLYANHSAWNQGLPKAPPHIWWAQEPQNTPWISVADQSQLNLRFLRHWDQVLDAADARDLVIHLMYDDDAVPLVSRCTSGIHWYGAWTGVLMLYMVHLGRFYVGNKNVNWPQRLSQADDIYWRNVLARFAAHPAVIMDVSKEAASYGVGKDYILNRLAMIHAMNAHKRLVTAHSGQWSAALCARRPAQRLLGFNCSTTAVLLTVHRAELEREMSGVRFDDAFIAVSQGESQQRRIFFEREEADGGEPHDSSCQCGVYVSVNRLGRLLM
jgi:hypothetical protein